MFENVSLFCQTTINHTSLHQFYSSLAAAIILRALSIPIVVVLSSIAQLLATVWNCCAHASAKWRSSVFMHVSVNDFNFHSSVIRCAVTPRSLSLLTEVQ